MLHSRLSSIVRILPRINVSGGSRVTRFSLQTTHLSRLQTQTFLYSTFSMDKFIESLGEKVQETRDELETALENKSTIYFQEDKKVALELFDEVMEMFQSSRTGLSADQLTEMDRRVGLKLEELKALKQQLEDEDEH